MQSETVGSFQEERGWVWLTAALLGLFLLLAYSNSFTGVFMMDDQDSIVENTTIRQFSTAFFPPKQSGITVSGRPLLNASFAINYAIGGTDPWGYHALNFIIHLLAGLALLGIVRRTFLLPCFGGRFRQDALEMGGAAACLWLLHPLQTESVTYIAQRAEALAGLFSFLALYAFIRGCETGGKNMWIALCFASCLLGMASKEVVAVVPVILFLYDRTFLAGTFRSAWGQRKKIYLLIASSWILLVLVMAASGTRGGTVGFGGRITPWHYFLTQCEAITMYLRLSFWPYPLVFDYGYEYVNSWTQVLPQFVFLTILGFVVVAALWKRPKWGFLGAWVFLFLGPTSSVIPLMSQTMAEHRMYLPLAGLAVLGVSALHHWMGQQGRWLFLLLACMCVGLTWNRNAVYQSPIAMWRDTVAKRPDNPRARNALGGALLEQGRVAEAKEEVGKSLALSPFFVPAYGNMALVYFRENKVDEALWYFEKLLEWRSDDYAAMINIATVLEKMERNEESIRLLEKVVKERPGNLRAMSRLAWMYAKAGNEKAAGNLFAEVLGKDSRNPDVLFQSGLFLAKSGRLQEARRHFEQVLYSNPHHVEAAYNLGLSHLIAGDAARALEWFQYVLRKEPRHAETLENMGMLYMRLGDLASAQGCLEKALEINPENAQTLNNLGILLFRQRRAEEAIHYFEEALRLRPGYAEAQKNLDRLRSLR